MMLERVPIAILKFFYPLQEPDHSRDRPLKVLCLGLGRTGTESLQTALYELGYNDVHHGFRISGDECAECIQWCRLAQAKYHDKTFLNRQQFDKVLGDCEAVTDLPSAAFAVELLQAYPEAKVILNRRRDVQSWYQSQVKTIDRLWKTWPETFYRWFNNEFFWLATIV